MGEKKKKKVVCRSGFGLLDEGLQPNPASSVTFSGTEGEIQLVRPENIEEKGGRGGGALLRS